MRVWFVVVLAAVATSLCANTPQEDLDILTSDADPLEAKQESRLELLERYEKTSGAPSVDGDTIVYQYGYGKPSLICATLRVCAIKLQPGERIINRGVQIGDKINWKLDVVYDETNDMTVVSLKPVDAGLDSSLTILTDRRDYHIQLLSTKDRYMPFIRFSFPEEEEERMWEAYEKAVGLSVGNGPVAAREDGNAMDVTLADLKNLNFKYRVSSCNCPWRPERVYDTGRQTIIEFPERVLAGKIPALTIVSSSNSEQIVNYRVNGTRYIVDQLFDRAKLSLVSGRKETSVTIDRVRSK